MYTDRVHVTETITANVVDQQFLVPAGSEEIFIIFNPVVNDTEAESKIALTLPTITLIDDTGTGVPFTTEIDAQNILVKVVRNHSLLYAHPRSLQLDYDSFSLLSQVGATYDLYIPSFAENYAFENEDISTKIDTTVVIPKSMGSLNLVTPDKIPLDQGDSWRLEFTHPELTGKVSWVQIGTTQYYEFHIKQPYVSTSTIPLFHNTYTVMLPRNVEAVGMSQKVWFSQIDPTPESVLEDSEGNLVAEFILPANESGEITISGLASVTNDPSTDLTISGNLSEITALFATESAPFWEVDDPAIKSAATDLQSTLGSQDIYQILAQTYEFVVDKIDYSEVKKFGLNERQGAVKTLQGGAAVCMEYSDLFIALMRAQGVPTRAAFGYGYDTRATDGENIAHQWTEVYFPSQNKWVAVDTTWGESGLQAIGGHLNHFYKYVTSKDPSTPAPVSVSYFGSLGEVPAESFMIESVSEIPATTNLLRQEDLIAQFPPTNSNLTFPEALLRSTMSTAQNIDNSVDKLIAKFVSQETIAMVKLGIYFVLVTSLLATSFLIIRRHKQKSRYVASTTTSI